MSKSNWSQLLSSPTSCVPRNQKSTHMNTWDHCHRSHLHKKCRQLDTTNLTLPSFFSPIYIYIYIAKSACFFRHHQTSNMALFQHIMFLCLTFFSITTLVSSHSRRYTTPSVPRLTDLFSHVSLNQSFSNVFGEHNIKLLNNGSMATLALDKTSGSGLASRNKYNYGFFSAAIKLPTGLTSGVVVAFYLSNADMYPHSHDEIDIELLGNDKRVDWVLQTNVYANGVTTGREEKFYFWFNPSLEYHYYSILWNRDHIVFLVDNIPVREFPNKGKFSAAYPSKPMSLYVTIWDGSEWATHGGKYPVNYKYAPFVASVKDTEVAGCAINPKHPDSSCSNASLSSTDPVGGHDFVKLSNQQVTAMDWARRKLMFYSYCKDTSRYKVLPSECK